MAEQEKAAAQLCFVFFHPMPVQGMSQRQIPERRTLRPHGLRKRCIDPPTVTWHRRHPCY